MGNMLLVIIPVVCNEKGSPFGAPEVCHTFGMGYASLSMAVCAIYMWSYVYNIDRILSRASPNEVEVNDSSKSKSVRESSIAEVGVSTELRTNDLAGSEHQPEQPVLPSTRFDDKSQVSLGTKLRQYIGVLSRKMDLKKLFAPCTSGAIAGFVVGLIPQIRKLGIGDAAPLHVVQDTAVLLGDGVVPLLTLVVGGNLLKGLRGSGVRKSILVGVIIVKYIAMPIMVLVLSKELLD